MSLNKHFTNDYKKLTPYQRYEALMAWNDLDPPLEDKDFESWALAYHKKKLEPKEGAQPWTSPSSSR